MQLSLQGVQAPFLLLDGASSHTAEHIKQKLAEAEIPVLQLPAYSPNLNLIEHIWAWIKNQLRRMHWIETIDQLDQQIFELWATIPRDVV